MTGVRSRNRVFGLNDLEAPWLDGAQALDLYRFREAFLMGARVVDIPFVKYIYLNIFRFTRLSLQMQAKVCKIYA